MVRQMQDGALPDLGTRWPGPVHTEGPAEPGTLRARHHSAAAGGHMPLPAQDLSPAPPRHTPRGPLALHTRGAHVLVFPKCSPGKRAKGAIRSRIRRPTHTVGPQILNCAPAVCEAPLSLNSQALELGSDTPRAGAQSGLTGLMHVTCASSSSYARQKPLRSLTRPAAKITGMLLPWGHCLE